MAAPPHHHSEAHAPATGNALLGALLLTLLFAGVEAVAGWWSGSLALLGDAGHMLSDAVALGLAAAAAWVARRPPSARHSYGLGRAEVVAALINGVLMLGIVAGIVFEALARLHAPQPVAGAAVVGVAAVGLAVNLVAMRLLAHGGNTLNVRAALLHVLGDLLGSVAALIAGGVIWLTGWTPIDPILSIFICVLILFSSLRLLGEALHVIMEGVPPHLDLAEIGRAMAGADRRVNSVHDLHVWTLSSGLVALSAHVVIGDMQAWDGILANLRRVLRARYDIEHVTLQPESPVATLVQVTRAP